jgi:hypothetical protein
MDLREWIVKFKMMSSKGERLDYLQILGLFRNINSTWIWKGSENSCVAWSAIISLSMKSVAKNGEPVKFPDFTRGQWRHKRELGIFKYEL